MEYFVSHSPDELAWHLETLINAKVDETVIAIGSNQTASDLGSTQVLISTPNRAHLFADLTACFSDLGLSVLDAKLHTSDAGRSIDIFIVQNEATCEPVTNSQDQETLLRGLEQAALGNYKERAGRSKNVKNAQVLQPTGHCLDPSRSRGEAYFLIELIAPDRAESINNSRPGIR